MSALFFSQQFRIIYFSSKGGSSFADVPPVMGRILLVALNRGGLAARLRTSDDESSDLQLLVCSHVQELRSSS